VAAACSVATQELPRPGTCDPFQLTAVVPAANSQGVAPDVVATLTFNDFPDPDTVGSSTLSLYTGFYFFTGSYTVDLVDRRASFRPSGPLAGGLGYTLLVKPGIRSLRGCSLQAGGPAAGPGDTDTMAFRFEVVGPTDLRHPDPVGPPGVAYPDVVQVFATHCAGAACHLLPGPDPSTVDACTTTPAGGLSLCASEARSALIGVPSRQVKRLVLVAPHDASRSYLLRKLIGAPPVVGHIGVPGDNLTQDDERAIQEWIETGASGGEASDGGL
jgi:hypothetical protein